MTKREKAMSIINHLKHSGLPARFIPESEKLQSQNELDLNLQYLRLNCPKCPLCDERPIIVGGTYRNNATIFFQAHCCGYKTELVKFDRLINEWKTLKRRDKK